MAKRFWKLAIAAIVLIMPVLIYLFALQATGNFHVVSEGKVYRAAQMDGQNLVRWQQEYGIASVLNLRGESIGSDWYETEKAVTEHLGVEHINFGMSASEELTDQEVQALLQVMRDAPKPLLIHCRAGADRTGIASALYVAGIDGGDEEAAERQLSLAYGHISLPWVSKAWAMDVTWERIEPWLGFPGS